MKPLQHAQISAKRYGGQWEDWYPLHDWFDRSKIAFPSVQHRLFLHSDFGCALVERVLGENITAQDGTVVPTSLLATDHLTEDLGRVVTLAEWLTEMDESALLAASERSLPSLSRSEQAINQNTLDGLVACYGGMAEDFSSLVSFFDEPARLTPQNPGSRWLLHNSFGIFLAEDLFGWVIRLADGRPLPVRGIAETLVKARLGFIPSAASVASRVRLRPWMTGKNVGQGLRKRQLRIENEPLSIVQAGGNS